MSPDIKVCPECGIDLSDRDLIGHALVHFPEYLDPAKSSKGARKNQALILAGGVSPKAYVDGKGV